MKRSILSLPIGACLVTGSMMAAPAVGANVTKPSVSPLSAPTFLWNTGGSFTLAAIVSNSVTCTFTSNRTVTGLTSAPCAPGNVSDAVTLPPNNSKKAIEYSFKLKVTGIEGRTTARASVTVSNLSAPSGLAWNTPKSITIGAPYIVSSIDKCPTTMPDGSAIAGTLYASVAVTYAGGGAGGVVPPNVDGSWSLNAELNGVYPTGKYSISASCYVYPSGPTLATYATQTAVVS